MSLNNNKALNQDYEQYRNTVFTPWSCQNEAFPKHIVDANGVYLHSSCGKKILDFKSQAFFANLGHNHQGMKNALKKACDSISIYGSDTYCQKRLELAQKLIAISPEKSMKKVFFTLGGAEANENAIKIARMVTKKFKVITRYRSYHGATLGMTSMSGDYRRIAVEPYMPGVIRIPDPYESGSGQHIDTVRLLEEIIEIEGGDTIAAIMLEGVTGANGVFLPPSDYWPRIRKLCDEHNIMLIDDEVFSGFFRTGKWFAVEHYNTLPDIITMSKGITAGYAPLGALMVNEKIASYFNENTLWCGLTQYGSYLSCAAALSAMHFYEAENIQENVQKRQKEFAQYLAELKEQFGFISEIRQTGLLAAIDFCKGPKDKTPMTKYRASANEAKPSYQLQKLLWENGVSILLRYSTAILAPPLNISAKELEAGMLMIKNALIEQKEIYYHMHPPSPQL